MIQGTLFDGMAERERILNAFRDNHVIYLNTLRSFARVHAMQHGEVSVDDVREACEREGIPLPEDLKIDGRVLGALFTKKEFEFIERRATRRAEYAKRVGRGRSDINVYRLTEKHFV